MRTAYILAAARTPIGDFRGALSGLPADVLGSVVIREVARRAGLGLEVLDEVIMGNVLPHGLGQNPARQAAIKAGVPFATGAFTVNKVCGSGLKAVMLGAQAIACGDAEVIVAGGMENMDQAPYLLPRLRTGARMGDAKAVDAMVRDGLWDVGNDVHMGLTAEWVAEKYDVSREEMDRLAAGSYEKAVESKATGRFREEIVAVPVPQKRGDPVLFDEDETPRPTPLETLRTLRSAFRKDGRVTAGNASKISDGAAAVLLASDDFVQAHGLATVARVGAQAAAGLDPKDVLVAPILSIPKVLAKAGLVEEDIDLHEINEAFAASSVAILRTLGIREDKVNVHGGAVALGHPIGASGARVLVTLLYALEARGLERGMASLCLGGGEAVSLIVERT
ncbi:MAG: acetyl-CoA C-acetyltransferase [Deltaproteobacteria bacterium]|nr:acetyl-CoA C-acetyltransferase [Deltaproteobacteria bacterium]